MLNSLNTFAVDNGLKANLDKTNVMIFNKNGRLIHKRFTLGGIEIKVTKELGVVPLHLYAKKNAITNWNRIAKLKQANELTVIL